MESVSGNGILRIISYLLPMVANPENYSTEHTRSKCTVVLSLQVILCQQSFSIYPSEIRCDMILCGSRGRSCINILLLAVH